MFSSHVLRGTGALVISALLDFLTFALCAPYSETTHGDHFDSLLEMVATHGRAMFKLFQVKLSFSTLFRVKIFFSLAPSSLFPSSNLSSFFLATCHLSVFLLPSFFSKLLLSYVPLLSFFFSSTLLLSLLFSSFSSLKFFFLSSFFFFFFSFFFFFFFILSTFFIFFPPFSSLSSPSYLLFSLLFCFLFLLLHSFFSFFLVLPSIFLSHSPPCLTPLQHPSMAIVKGAGLIMKAIIEEGEPEIASKMQGLALAEGALPSHLLTAMYTVSTDSRMLTNRWIESDIVRA